MIQTINKKALFLMLVLALFTGNGYGAIKLIYAENSGNTGSAGDGAPIDKDGSISNPGKLGGGSTTTTCPPEQEECGETEIIIDGKVYKVPLCCLKIPEITITPPKGGSINPYVGMLITPPINTILHDLGGGGLNYGLLGGGTGNTAATITTTPLIQAIFKNSNMTEENRKKIENMLEKIIKDCLGNALYNEIKNNALLYNLIDNRINIVYNPQAATASFDKSANLLTLNNLGNGTGMFNNGEHGTLVHEMAHWYQAFKKRWNAGNEANMEAEAKIAQASFMMREENLTQLNKNMMELYRNDLSMQAANMLKFLNNNGSIKPGSSASFNTRYQQLLDAIHTTNNLYTKDSNSVELTNLQELSKNCK